MVRRKGDGRLQQTRSGGCPVSKPLRASHQVAGRGRFDAASDQTVLRSMMPGRRETCRPQHPGRPRPWAVPSGAWSAAPRTVSTVLERVRLLCAQPSSGQPANSRGRGAAQAGPPCASLGRPGSGWSSPSVPTPGSVTRESRLAETVPLPGRTRKVREEGRAASAAPSGALHRHRSNDTEGRRCRRLRRQVSAQGFRIGSAIQFSGTTGGRPSKAKKPVRASFAFRHLRASFAFRHLRQA